jgi:hypothetical protein
MGDRGFCVVGAWFSASPVLSMFAGSISVLAF